VARPQLPPSSRPTYFGGTPTSQQGYNRPQLTAPIRGVPNIEDYSPEAQERREVERYIAENPLSTAQEVDYGALQFAENYGPYEGPDNAGVPRIAAARARSAQAIIRAGLTPERASTLEKYPTVARALVNAGLMMYPERPSETFPEGDPRAAMRQSQRMAVLGVPTDSVVEEDVARLLNVVELDTAARKYLLAGAMGDDIRQQNILSTMGPLDQIALLDTVYQQASEALERRELVPDWMENVFHYLTYVVDGLWWLNRQAVRAFNANVEALQDNPANVFAAGPLFGVGQVLNTVRYWDDVAPGQYDQQMLAEARAKHGDKAIDVIVDITNEYQKEKYVWDPTGQGGFLRPWDQKPEDRDATPFEIVFKKYQDDPEALEVLRGLIYTQTENPELVEAMQAVDAASNSNMGLNLLQGIPTDVVSADSPIREIGGNVINVVGAFALDPTLGASKVTRTAKVLRYSMMKLAPGADITAALSVPAVRREMVSVVEGIQRYKALAADEAAGRGRTGVAANFRATFERNHADIAPIMDDLLEFNGGVGVKSVNDVRDLIVAGNDIDSLLRGVPVAQAREIRTVYERLYGAASQTARRDVLMPRAGRTKNLRNRTKELLAIHGVGARAGSKRLEKMFGKQGLQDPAYVAAVLNDASGLIGEASGIAPRQVRSPLLEATGFIGKRRPAVAEREGCQAAQETAQVLAAGELNPGKFRYADTTLYGRVTRLTRLFVRKPNAAIISTKDGRDANKIYTFARAFFTKYEARAIADAYKVTDQATRINIRNGLVRSAAEVLGVRYRFGLESDRVIDDLITGNRAWEQYSPTRVFKRNEDGSVTTYNPADFGGPGGAKQHPLHLWQTSDYVKMPDFTDMELIQQRAGFWNALMGWADTNPAKTVTDAWSLGTLFGPRFIQRSALEDYVMWSMTSGSWAKAIEGRRLSTRIRAYRDGLGPGRIPKNVKYEVGAATYFGGEGSRLGFFNRRKKPKGERYTAQEATNNAFGRFILERLDEVEADELVTALINGDKPTQTRLIATSLMRIEGMRGDLTPLQARGIASSAIEGYVQHKMDDVLEQATYLNSVRTTSTLDRTIEDLGVLDGVTLARGRADIQFVDVDMRLASPADFMTWYRGIDGAVSLDGKLGTVGVAKLPQYLNPETRSQVIDELATIIREDKVFGYKGRLAALSEPGVTPEVFVTRYMDDVANLFSKADGSLNDDLWSRVVSSEINTLNVPAGNIGNYGLRAAGPDPGTDPGIAYLLRYDSLSSQWVDIARNPANETAMSDEFRLALDNFSLAINWNALPDNFERLSVLGREMAKADGRGAIAVGNQVIEIDPSKTVTRVTLDNLSTEDLMKYDPADRPVAILGREITPIPNLNTLGAMDKIWSVLGAQYNRISRDPFWTANYAKEIDNLQGYRDYLAPIIGEAQADYRTFKLAADRAYDLTLAYSDNPANRTIFAWKVRNLSRYYRATEDFFRRMMRITKNYPEGIWKIALTYDVMEDTGFVWEDDRGSKYFMYPLAGFFNQQISNAIRTITGDNTLSLNPFEIGGKVNMLLPSSDPNQLIASATGPLGVLPFSAVFSVVPQFEALERVVLGEYAQDAKLWEQIFPAGLVRVFKGLNFDERSAAYGNAMKAALQISIAAGIEPKNTSPEAQIAYREQIATMAQHFLIGKTVLGFFVPASPQFIPGDVTTIGREMGVISMNRAFRSMLDSYGDDPYAYEQALVDFYSTFGPQAMPYTVGSTSTPGADDDPGGLMRTAALDSMTDKAYDWVRKNDEVVKKFPVAATFLYPRDGEFDIKMWAWYQRNKFKQPTPEGAYIRKLLSAEGRFEYDQTQKYLLGLQDSGTPFVAEDGTEYEVTDEFIQISLKDIRNNNPWADIDMSSSSYQGWIASVERLLNGDASTKGEVRQMIDYYYSDDFVGPIPTSVQKITEAVQTFDYWKAERDVINARTKDGRAERNQIDATLKGYVTEIGEEDPNAKIFIERVLIPLLEVNLYGSGEFIPTGVLVGR
jgi:hypothetical protein